MDHSRRAASLPSAEKYVSILTMSPLCNTHVEYSLVVLAEYTLANNVHALCTLGISLFSLSLRNEGNT